MIDELWIIHRVTGGVRHAVAFRSTKIFAHQHRDALAMDLAKWTEKLRPIRERCREAFVATFDGMVVHSIRRPDDHPAHARFDRARVEMIVAIDLARQEALDPAAILADDDPYSHVEYEIESVPPSAPDRWTVHDESFRAATGMKITRASILQNEADRAWPATLALELGGMSCLRATVDAAWDRLTSEDLASGADLSRFSGCLVSRVWYAQVHRDRVLPVLLSIEIGEAGIVVRSPSPIYFMNGMTGGYTRLPFPGERPFQPWRDQ